MPLPKPQKCLKSGKFFLNGFTIVWWSEENKLLWNFQNQIHVIKTILLFLSTFMDKQALIFMFKQNNYHFQYFCQLFCVIWSFCGFESNDKSLQKNFFQICFFFFFLGGGGSHKKIFRIFEKYFFTFGFLLKAAAEPHLHIKIWLEVNYISRPYSHYKNFIFGKYNLILFEILMTTDRVILLTR